MCACQALRRAASNATAIAAKSHESGNHHMKKYYRARRYLIAGYKCLYPRLVSVQPEIMMTRSHIVEHILAISRRRSSGRIEDRHSSYRNQPNSYINTSCIIIYFFGIHNSWRGRCIKSSSQYDGWWVVIEMLAILHASHGFARFVLYRCHCGKPSIAYGRIFYCSDEVDISDAKRRVLLFQRHIIISMQQRYRLYSGLGLMIQLRSISAFHQPHFTISLGV